MTAYLEIQLSKLYHKLTADKELLSAHQTELEATQAEIESNKGRLSKLNTLFIMGNISEGDLQEYSKQYKDSITLLEEKQKRLESYSLYKIAEQIQNKIVRLENMQSNADINELVQLIDHVDYWKDQTGISVNTKFKE